MTALAGEHLTDLKHAVHAPDIAHQAAQPAVRAELSQLAHVLVRYHDQIATGFGVPHTPDHGVRDAARRASTLINHAEQLLGPRSTTEAPESVLAEKIRCVSIALGCGLDLLVSHAPTGLTEPVSADAPTIAATDTARALLHQLSTHTATVGHLAKHTGAPSNTATRPLLTAAVLSRVFGTNERPPINSVPLHHIPERIPPAVGETLEHAFAGLNASIQRLNNPNAPGSLTTWRYLARAAAITCDLNSKTILHLTRRMEELNETDQVSHLKQVTPSIRRTAGRWKAITRRWDAYDSFGHPVTSIATDASDLIIRLGRIIHADPAWTPSPRASYRVKLPEELAANTTDAVHIATAALKALEACNVIAANHHTALNDVAVMSVLQQQQQRPSFSPRVPASTRRLLGLYEATEAQGIQTATTLGRAIQALAADNPDHTDEARLIMRRAASKAAPTQSTLAATGFPTPIGECLADSQAELRSPSPNGGWGKNQKRPTP
ncbi:hypothetical protein F8568_022525 [Actinomadura sp. LD22]|uniref:Uncharacterized protein n=1 Tax=Actinomadura physcomitrii TaxID=2650748 RepID=A0A6I4M861_9ACTN|nr:hypothetical protein [Actinomadura physcomitrii]MWA02328.1 hypothetical protein [Actinomadura physcomitrii]MWA03100.1 hypothetical protein [Actinomadura physcomitrii]